MWQYNSDSMNLMFCSKNMSAIYENIRVCNNISMILHCNERYNLYNLSINLIHISMEKQWNNQWWSIELLIIIAAEHKSSGHVLQYNNSRLCFSLYIVNNTTEVVYRGHVIPRSIMPCIKQCFCDMQPRTISFEESNSKRLLQRIIGLVARGNNILHGIIRVNFNSME